MPFGISNAPAAFQRWINRILRRYLDICCIVYLDDVLVYSKSLTEHWGDVRNILEAIKESGMKLKPLKCEFHKEEIEYLGFIINSEGVMIDPVKTNVI